MKNSVKNLPGAGVKMQRIGDILISPELTVTEEYAVELKNSMIEGKCYYGNNN